MHSLFNMKILHWALDNILFVFTLFLLAFIPLYPKLPILDVVNTWVYVRAEDFVVVCVLLVWMFLFLSRRITLRTPLTMPILLFWMTGAIATIHGVLLIFPGLANVFPNVAFLSFLRRIEYLSLFFVAYSGMKDKRFLPLVVVVLSLTLLFVSLYGFGQKYIGFPAYLTMNEEFAKGEAIRLSALSRVPSTFGGHYDLAAYLVFIIPILTSMVFGFKNLFIRLMLLGSVFLGFILLFMTVSRVSFFVLLVSLFVVILFQKKKLLLFSLPVVILFGIIFLSSSSNLLQRFGNTVKEVDVLVDAKTGEAIGHPQVVPAKYFENKVIMQDFALQNKVTVDLATPSGKLATPSGRVLYTSLPENVVLLVPPNAPTGESLPQGTGYINLSLSPVTKRLGEYFYEVPQKNTEATRSADVIIIHGNYLVKKASAYDLSFTTRFQGEWPHALEAFKRNVFFGSGYSSISLAVDNNYLRILGEVGLFGFISFLALFLAIGIFIRKTLPEVDSPLAKSFVLGFVAGVLGLALNAILIDVFEASKIAFLLWLLTGVTLGLLNLYQRKYEDLHTEEPEKEFVQHDMQATSQHSSGHRWGVEMYSEFKKAAFSPFAIVLYIGVLSAIIFSPMIGNYFVADDFTWFRWAADCESVHGCPSVFGRVLEYFTKTDGFFYRPGTKVYFLLMYSIFWLNQTMYHIVSIFLHFVNVVLVFFLAKKILKNSFSSFLCALLFLILSSYSEAVFWISATGHLLNAMFMLLSVLFFILWEEKKKTFFFVISFASLVFSLLFHELGVVTPLLLLLYKFVFDDSFKPSAIFHKVHYMLLFLPLVPYLLLRFLSGSHWQGGDYNYNIIKLPFNIVGNIIGYVLLTLIGPLWLSFYQALRNVLKTQLPVAIIIFLVLVVLFFLAYRIIAKRIEGEDKKTVVFSLFFFIIALLPFLGLGNIASRYSYLAAFGIILLFVFFMQKFYRYLLINGKDIATSVLVLAISFFCLLHVIQLQQIHGDWHEAGLKARRFLVSIESVYVDSWAKDPLELYFVNIPIRQGEAWVYPVGLSDALWFAFRNPNINVHQTNSVEEALSRIDSSVNEKVFEFDDSGKITERRKVLNVQ